MTFEKQHIFEAAILREQPFTFPPPQPPTGSFTLIFTACAVKWIYAFEWVQSGVVIGLDWFNWTGELHQALILQVPKGGWGFRNHAHGEGLIS